MATHAHLSETKVGKKEASSKLLTVKVRNEGKKERETTADFSFLLPWLGSSAARVVDALRKFTRRYSSATPLYNVRIVLRFWNEYQHEKNLSNFLDLNREELERQISALRYAFFRAQTESGRSLATTSLRWKTFLAFVEVLVLTEVVPSVRVALPSLMAPPKKDLIAPRETAASTIAARGPRNLNHEGDSYNENLYEQLSISRCDAEYLQEYKARLKKAIETIKQCALKDFRDLVAKHIEGKALIESACGGMLDALHCGGGRDNFYDAVTGVHILDPKEKHPKLLANLLYIVNKQMGGLPKVHIKYTGRGNKKPISNSGNPHWKFIQLYGKNKLFPYLGIMSSCSMVVCLVLILLEHPNINASSLIRARLADPEGNEILLAATGEGDKSDTRLTVKKPRSGYEKSAELSPLAKEVIEQVINWTRAAREDLQRSGDLEGARALWVGVSMNSLEPIAFSHKSALNSLKLDRFRSRGEKMNQARITPFVERHQELHRWASKINFKTLRVNCGVLKYLETDGDLVATARTFGHKNIETTIGNYIPRPLRLAMHERQIRRHQNKLIITSLDDELSKLELSDFSTTEELHAFLSSQPTSQVYFEDEDIQSGANELDATSLSRKGRVVIYDNLDAMAIAMLYRNALQDAPSSFINLPDRLTGLPPKFWIRFVDALMEPLPLSFTDIQNFVIKAKDRMAVLKETVVFPRCE